jgi:iron complex transport system ATP-binding protein
MTASPLRTQQLCLRIGTRELCRDLTVAMYGGQRWAILGVNGAGKSTLLHTLAGLRKPATGQIILGDRPLSQWTRRAISQQLALLLQEAPEPLGGHVFEHVLLGRHPHLGYFDWESTDDIHIAQQALRAVELAALAERDITTLSGGERQRLAIALVLTQQTPILLLDEPVNHLDIRHQHLLLDHLRALSTNQNNLLVMAIHDVNLARRYCDHAILMFADGECCAGKIEAMLTEENLSRLYNYPVKLVETTGGVVIVPG